MEATTKKQNPRINKMKKIDEAEIGMRVLMIARPKHAKTQQTEPYFWQDRKDAPRKTDKT